MIINFNGVTANFTVLKILTLIYTCIEKHRNSFPTIGTLILVSHDRDFVQGLCEKVISFKEREVKPFLGDINAYLEFQKLSSLKELEKKNTFGFSGKKSE